MWDILLAILIGAAIPLIIQWIQSREKSKFFDLERKEKFRIAAIEKRLEAHQKAYAQLSRFWDIIDSNSREEVRDMIKEGKEFMYNYSLYLESGTRKKMDEVLGFLNAYCPREYYISKLEPSERTKALNTYIKEEQRLNELGKLIQEEVALEPITLNYKQKSESK